MIKDEYTKYEVAELLFEIAFKINHKKMALTELSPKLEGYEKYGNYGKWDGLYEAGEIIDEMLERVQYGKCKDTERVSDDE